MATDQGGNELVEENVPYKTVSYSVSYNATPNPVVDNGTFQTTARTKTSFNINRVYASDTRGHNVAWLVIGV